MKKLLARLGLRRFVPNCYLCAWSNTVTDDEEPECVAQAYQKIKKVYMTKECYMLFLREL